MATRNIVPRATGEGSLGTAAKKWGDVKTVLLNGGAASIGNAQGRISGDITTTSGSAVDATGFSFAIAANEVWTFDITLNLTGITGGTKFAVNGPSAATLMAQVFGMTSGVTAFRSDVISALATLSATALVTSNGTTGMLVRITGVIVNSSTPGTVQLQWASVTGGNTSTIKANSSFTATRIA